VDRAYLARLAGRYAAAAGVIWGVLLGGGTALADPRPVGTGDGAPTTADVRTAPPTSQPAEPEAEAPAPAAWPPGLLMQGLDAAGLGKPMRDLGLRAYGYVETGMTFKLHGPFPRRDGLPLRGFESRRPGELRLNQVMLTLDRPLDTSKNFDIGGRIDALYGTDARSIHSLGMFDTNQLDHDLNYDIPQGYGEMWFKTGADGQGLNVTFGKWFTTMGAEVLSAPGNYLYSRSLLYVFAEPVTHTGLKLTYFFDPGNSVYFAVVRGWDQFKDANSNPSWMAGFTLSSKELMGSNPRSQLAFNFMIGPEQPGGWVEENRLLTDIVWTWRWTEKLTQVMNFDWGWEDNVPGALNSEYVPGRGDAAWYGLSYMLNYVINDYVSTTGRFDWFTDNAGVRTGYRGTFFEATTGLSITPFPKHPILSNLMLRPELRADWSANDAPFAERCQWTAAFDIVYKF
jgi:hypothetical protein